MSTFYETFLSLCNSKGKTPSRSALDMGISKTAVTRWKQGYCPTDANFQKIADYFNVSIQYLKGEEEPQKEKPLSEDEERLKELFDLTADLSETELAMVKAYAAGIKANRGNH